MAYIKDFDGWNKRKKIIDTTGKHVFSYRGEIWWCSLGVNIDVEIDGKNDLLERPVLIIKKVNLQSMWIVPLTSTYKDNVYTYKLKTLPYYLSISQIRSVSSKRLLRRICKISQEEFLQVIIRIKYILSI